MRFVASSFVSGLRSEHFNLPRSTLAESCPNGLRGVPENQWPAVLYFKTIRESGRQRSTLKGVVEIGWAAYPPRWHTESALLRLLFLCAVWGALDWCVVWLAEG